MNVHASDKIYSVASWIRGLSVSTVNGHDITNMKWAQEFTSIIHPPHGTMEEEWKITIGWQYMEKDAMADICQRGEEYLYPSVNFRA
jgi:hypothetical protein